jgi:hypothetical protein
VAEQAVQTLLFPTLFAKPLVATFDTGHQSSDGGAILLKVIDDELGLTARLAACIPEWRQEGKIDHDLPTLIRQRCFGLACGYADANDAARLKADPIHKLLVGRDPVAGTTLASQPTLSRFENIVGPRDLYRLTQTLADVVIAAHQARLAHKRVRRLLGKARMRSRTTGATATLFGETRYAAKSWGRKRRVIMKAEVVRLTGRDPRDNPRFVVTNLAQSPRRVYALYRERGDVENRLKELHYGLGFDRTSCPAFWANAFRVLLTAAAYVLLQGLRARLATTPAATLQVPTLRERLFKLGARVQVSARRIVLHLPSAFPWLALWQAVALALGARLG